MSPVAAPVHPVVLLAPPCPVCTQGLVLAPSGHLALCAACRGSGCKRREPEVRP